MNHTTLTNFINNTEAIINNTISNNEVTAIKSEEGSAVIMSGKQYNYLVSKLKDIEKLTDQ